MCRSKWIVLLAFAFHGAVAQDTTQLRLLFVGDIMQHDSNIAAAFDAVRRKYDYMYCFQYVAPIIQSADVAIGNLELTLGDKPFKGYPQFSAPDELAEELKRIGFDVLVTANNHSVDRGKKGIERTISILDTLGIMHTGTFRDSADRARTYPLLLEKNGFRISLLNYTYGTNGIPVPAPTIVNLIDTVQIKLDLKKARGQHADVIVVFFHWGNEYQSLPNKEQKQLTELSFREGAKVVIGAHPHVLQPMEWRQESDRFVAYSLGNFISGQRPRYRDGGAMVWLELEKIKTDSAAFTSIRHAEYELAWVLKTNDEQQDFVLLPLRYFETDSVFIGDRLLQQSFSLFKKDSRQLLGKHNVAVTERPEPEADTVTYSVMLGLLTEENVAMAEDDPIIRFFGLHPVRHDNERTYWLAGKFGDAATASQALNEIKSKTGFKSSRVVKWISSGY
jgi:poly-gamma-glutamate capsule biosynthesis protein CapA/YwtB (metallophosphatase superfamily)